MKFVSLGLFVLFFWTFITSCMPDRCRDNICANRGVCVDGNCSCLNGYEGVNCEEKWNTRLLGDWISTEQDAGVPAAQYPIRLLDNGNPGQFLVMNLGDQFDSIICRRKSSTEFAFSENQQIGSFQLVKSGSGIMDTVLKTITASYTLQLKDTVVTYHVVWHK